VSRIVAQRGKGLLSGRSASFVGTVSEAIDLIGRFKDAAIDLLIYSDPRNDAESRELLVSDVMPHVA
jgi:hypothetical protein